MPWSVSSDVVAGAFPKQGKGQFISAGASDTPGTGEAQLMVLSRTPKKFAVSRHDPSLVP